MATAKLNTSRKTIRIEMVKNYSALRAGQVLEVHPNMAARLIAKDVAKKSNKALSSAIPASKIN